MMIYIVTCFIVCICVVLFIVSWRRESRYSVVFTPFLLLMVNEFLRVMPAYVFTAISGDATDLFPLLVFFVGFVSLIMGFLWGLEYLGYRSFMPIRSVRRDVVLTSEGGTLFAVFCGVAVLFVAGLYLYQGLPSVTKALIGMVANEEVGEVLSSIAESRRYLTKGYYFGEAYRGQGLIRSFIHVGWPFLCCLALVFYFRTRKRLWLFTLAVLLILSFIFVAGEGTRAPFINMLIVLIILYSFLKNIRYRSVLPIVLLLIVIAILIGIYSPKSGSFLQRKEAIWTVASKVCKRILIGNGLSDIWAIRLIDTSVLHYRLGDLHMRDFVAAFPGTKGGLPFAHELYLLLNPGKRGTTYATGTYITKAFVDFGIIGVGFLFFGIGLFAGFSQNLILRMRRVPLDVTMAAFLAFYTGGLVMNGPIGMASGMVVVLSFYLLIRMFILLSAVFMIGTVRSKPFSHASTPQLKSSTKLI